MEGEGTDFPASWPMTHTEASAVGTGSWRLTFILAPAKVTLLLGSGLGQQTVLVGQHPDQCNKPCLERSQKKRQKRPHTTQGWCLDFTGGCGGFFFLLKKKKKENLFPIFFFFFVKMLKDLGKDFESLRKCNSISRYSCSEPGQLGLGESANQALWLGSGEAFGQI